MMRPRVNHSTCESNDGSGSQFLFSNSYVLPAVNSNVHVFYHAYVLVHNDTLINH